MDFELDSRNLPMNNVSAIDSHAHITWPDFFPYIDKIIQDAKMHNISEIINLGVGLCDFRVCLELREKSPIFYNAIGIHPEFSLDPKNDPDDFIAKISKYKKEFIAIGEIGLDFLVIKDHRERNISEAIFRKMLNFAVEIQKPIVIHCRNAEKQTLKILEESQYSDIKGVVLHCFGGAPKFIQQALNHDNWYFTIPTSVIFKNLHQKLAESVPVERMMLESDAPFLSPFPEKMNLPSNVLLSAEKIAKMKDMSLDEVLVHTNSNVKVFYALPR